MFTDWKLSDLKPPTKGKVFTCFAGGGGVAERVNKYILRRTQNERLYF